MGEDLPIDIDYAKFLDWLIDRRRVQRSWHASLKAARVLLRSAADSIPSDSSVIAPTSYFDLIDVLNILSDHNKPSPFPGARDTDLFNRYSHPTSRAWTAAKSSYESGSAFLAEAAQRLVRNADVEAPAIRAHMSRLKDVLADCARKEGPTLRAAHDAKERFRNACADLDIPHTLETDFETEIRKYVKREAPKLLRTAVSTAKDPILRTALEYYSNFVRYTCPPEDSSECIPNEKKNVNDIRCTTIDSGVCPILQTVIDAETERLISPVREEQTQRSVNGADIHYENLGAGGSYIEEIDTDVGIDWGIAVDSAGLGASDVVCGEAERDAKNETGLGDSIVTSTDEIGIDWGTTSLALGDDVQRDVCDVEESSGKGSLSDPGFRESYMNDLLELRTFLLQRKVELSDDTKGQASLVLQQFSNLPDCIRSVEAPHINEMLKGINLAMNCISGAEALKLLRLHASNDAIAQHARDISEKMHVASRIEGSIATLHEKKVRTSEELRALTPKFDALATETRQLLRRTEHCLEQHYKGRKVNILGEINVIFPCDD